MTISKSIPIEITQATEDDIPKLYQIYDEIGQKDQGYFETCFEKDCLILMASLHSAVIPRRVKRQGDEARDVGFGVLNFEPKYNLYQKLDIPEIQDLNVIPAARRQGVATTLIEAFENMARDQGAEMIGISVGLTKDYGPAQRLYNKLGYMPDGNGVTYDRAGVEKGRRYPVDDDLCLMFLKEL